MLLFGWFLRRLFKEARPIWHGNASTVARWNTGRSMEVTARSFFAFLLTMASFAVAMILLPVAAIGMKLTRSGLWLIPAGIALLCIGLMLCGIVLHALVNAFNRPRWLVPPPYRDQPGWVAQRRVGRRNPRSRPGFRRDSWGHANCASIMSPRCGDVDREADTKPCQPHQ